MPNRIKVDWSKVDWTRTNMQIAISTGVSRSAVIMQRKNRNMPPVKDVERFKLGLFNRKKKTLSQNHN